MLMEPGSAQICVYQEYSLLRHSQGKARLAATRFSPRLTRALVIMMNLQGPDACLALMQDDNMREPSASAGISRTLFFRYRPGRLGITANISMSKMRFTSSIFLGRSSIDSKMTIRASERPKPTNGHIIQQLKP